jgi:hypothetical protein
LDIGNFIYNYGDLKNKSLTGFSVSTIKETVSKALNMPLISKIFLIIQWSLILIVLFYVFLKDKTISTAKEESNTDHKGQRRYKTDLDTLYDTLKKNKELKISTIARLFKISIDVATEWSKILEAGELATIEYPGFGEPKIVIKEEKDRIKEGETEEERKEKNNEELKNPELKKRINKGILEKFFPKKEEINKEKHKEISKIISKNAKNKMSKKINSTKKLKLKKRNNPKKS